MGMLERLSDVRGTIEGKIVAVVLAILLVLPMASISAFANNGNTSEEPQEGTTTTETVETSPEDTDTTFGTMVLNGDDGYVSGSASSSVTVTIPAAKETAYTAVHTYYTNSTKDGETREDITDKKVGDVVYERDITKVYEYAGDDYDFIGFYTEGNDSFPTEDKKLDMPYSLIDGNNIIYLVYGRTVYTTNDKPVAPSHDEVYKLTDNVIVSCDPEKHTLGRFDCIINSKGADHTYRIVIGAVEGNDQNGYTCKVTFLAEKYAVDYGKLKSKEHALVSGEKDKTITLQWQGDGDNGAWALPADFVGPISFIVTCEDPGPGLRSGSFAIAKEFDGLAPGVDTPELTVDYIVQLTKDGKAIGEDQTGSVILNSENEYKVTITPSVWDVSSSPTDSKYRVDHESYKAVFTLTESDASINSYIHDAFKAKYDADGKVNDDSVEFTVPGPTSAKQLTLLNKYKADRNNNGTADDNETKYTVTYTDGVVDEEVFADQITENLLEGDAVPAFAMADKGTSTDGSGNVTPVRKGYFFNGWNPEIAGTDDTVTQNITYTAQWVPEPTETDMQKVLIQMICEDPRHNSGGHGLYGNYESDGALQPWSNKWRTVGEVEKQADGTYQFIVTVHANTWGDWWSEHQAKKENGAHQFDEETTGGEDIPVTFTYENGAWNADKDLVKVFVNETKVTVVWVDEDGTTTLDGPIYFAKGGKEPTTQVVPSKDEDDNYTYEFAGWERSEDENSNVTYTATYAATPKPAPKLTNEEIQQVRIVMECEDNGNHNSDEYGLYGNYESDGALQPWFNNRRTIGEVERIGDTNNYQCVVTVHANAWGDWWSNYQNGINDRGHEFDAEATGGNDVAVTFTYENGAWSAVANRVTVFVNENVIRVTWLDGYSEDGQDVLAEKEYARAEDQVVPEEDFPQNLTREGYTFVGWSDPSTDDAGNITYTAQWNPVVVVPGTETPVPDVPTPTVPGPTPTILPLVPGPAPVLTPFQEGINAVADFLATPVLPLAGIADDETPLADIEDEETPMSAFDHPFCWVHYYIILGIIITAIYGGGVIARRLGYNHKIKKYEDDVTGKEKKKGLETEPADSKAQVTI